MSHVVQNFILFQIGWFVCVLGGASDYSLLALPTVAAIIAMHLLRARSASDEISLILTAILIGTIWDSALTMTGLLNFSTGIFVEGFAPYWIIAMWALFATTLNVSLKWFRGKWLLSAVFGAAGGALAYYAGHRLGAVEFSHTLMSLGTIAAGWFFIMPLLMFIAVQFDGFDDSDTTHNKQIEVFHNE